MTPAVRGTRASFGIQEQLDYVNVVLYRRLDRERGCGGWRVGGGVLEVWGDHEPPPSRAHTLAQERQTRAHLLNHIPLRSASVETQDRL